MVRLNVSYKEKDLAKSKGAKWNPDVKTWFVDDMRLLSELSRWVDIHNIICKKIYVFEMKRVCWKCKKETNVVCLGTDESYSLESSYKKNCDILLFSYLKHMPISLADYMNDKFGYYPSYSKAIDDTYFINHCKYCKSVQGDNFLHEVPDESFYKKLCYRNAEPTVFFKVNNKFDVLLEVQLPYYDEVAGSEELMWAHLRTGVENRGSLNITQKLMNGLFVVSTHKEDIYIDGV